MMGYYYDGYGLGFGMGFGFIWMLLFWAGIIWFIIWLVNQSRSRANDKTASEILKERYASGEISRKEYEQMKKEIGR